VRVGDAVIRGFALDGFWVLEPPAGATAFIVFVTAAFVAFVALVAVAAFFKLDASVGFAAAAALDWCMDMWPSICGRYWWM